MHSQASLSSQPKAILVISGHWEEDVFTIGNAPSPPLIYDYYGFPPSTYQLTYPAPGSPALGQRIMGLLQSAHIEVQQDPQRGYDHGVFIPFKVMYPAATLPIVQLSLKKGLDPKEHLALGAALAPLRDEGILIIGSGMSYHNLSEFRQGGPDVTRASQEFGDWLDTSISLPREDRALRLCQWDKAPSGKRAHPREEHLIPLMVVAGAAQEDVGRVSYQDILMGTEISAYQFG